MTWKFAPHTNCDALHTIKIKRLSLKKRAFIIGRPFSLKVFVKRLSTKKGSFNIDRSFSSKLFSFKIQLLGKVGWLFSKHGEKLVIIYALESEFGNSLAAQRLRDNLLFPRKFLLSLYFLPFVS